MAAITYATATAYNVSPTEKRSMYQVTATKSAINDTLNVGLNATTNYTPIKTILYVLAHDAAGTVEPVTWTGQIITFTSATTGVISLIVVGSC